MQIRIRSGGHDYEGLSYVSTFSFVVIDLINLQTINVDAENKTAWVQSGATIGEVYYRIAEKSRTLAFPASVCPTVGVGGHFSGGGYGMLMRKYGLAADHIIDAQLVDVKADKLHEDLFIRIILNRVNSTEEGKSNTTIQASFNSLFLGGIDRLLPLIQDSFPELGLVKEDCIEMSWIQSVLYFDGFPSNSSLDILLDRTPSTRRNFKAKSDYVKEPIPELGLEGIWERFFDEDINTPILIFSPYGGKMSEISESSIPFPHRAGNIYKIQHLIYWDEEGIVAAKRHISWIRRLYSYLAPYVSKTPRAAYVNYRDLDIGINNHAGNTSYRQASIWGLKYFKNNFDRLVRVKTAVDPANFFRNEQTTSTFNPICTFSPTPSPTSATTPAPTPITNTNTNIALSPTFAPSPIITIPTPAPSSAPTPINNTTTTSTTLTPTTTPSTAPTPIPTNKITLTPTFAPSLAPTPTIITPILGPSPAPTPISSSTFTTTPTFDPSPAPTPTNSSIFTATFSSLPPTPPSTFTPQQDDLKFVFQEQIYNIIDAILGTGDFKNWANALSMADSTTFPISATFFIPSDNSLSPITTSADPDIFPYHIVPQRLSFADLQQFKTFSRLPTLLFDKSILITNNSASHFTLDGSRLTHPDIYTNAAITVHGIDNLLDHSVYGTESGKNSSKPDAVGPPPTPASPPRPTPRTFVPSTADDEEFTVHQHGESDAACLCTEVWTVFLVLCVALASKFQRMILVH
ncbi:hypothetical protein Peur_037405 [Populus x canadensis]